jgi:thiamine phosphate synthase YjbQ (UPF0047 family)
MMTYQRVLEFNTTGRGSRNISAAVARVVEESGVQTGLAHLFAQHTSCSLAITENADPARPRNRFRTACSRWRSRLPS